MGSREKAEWNGQKINKINRQDQYRPRSKELNMDEKMQPDIQTKWWGAGGRDLGGARGLTVLHTSPTRTHTHTPLHFLYCEANSWKMIFCVWCSSSKSSIELQLLLSFTHFAVLPLRIENEPQKALIIVVCWPHTHSKVVWVVCEWVYSMLDSVCLDRFETDAQNFCPA